MAGFGSKYRLVVGAAVKVAEPTRLVKRAWPAAVYAVGAKLEDGLTAELLG